MWSLIFRAGCFVAMARGLVLVAAFSGSALAQAVAQQVAPAPVEPVPEAASPDAAPSDAAGAPPPARLEQELAPAPSGTAGDRASEARQHFDRGVQLYAEGEFAVALAEFERAYELMPNVRVLYNIAQLCFQLQKFSRARQALSRYLVDASRELTPERRAAVERDLAALALRTATLRLRVRVPGTEVMIDGVPATSAGPEGFIIDAGERSVRVDKPGYRSVERHAKVVGGDRLDWVIELEPLLPPQVSRPPPPVPVAMEQPSSLPLWLPWVITGALAAGWATTGLLALDAQADKDELEGDTSSPESELLEARDSLRTLALVTDVLLGATVAATGVSLYLSLSSDGRDATAPPVGAVRLPRSAIVGLSGGF